MITVLTLIVSLAAPPVDSPRMAPPADAPRMEEERRGEERGERRFGRPERGGFDREREREWGRHPRVFGILCPLFFLGLLTFHILATIVVAKDLKRSGLSMIWPFMVAIGGLFGLMPYAVFRLSESLFKSKEL